MTRWRAALVTLLLCGIAAETAGWAGYRILTGAWWTPAGAHEARAQVVAQARVVAATETTDSGLTAEAVAHPFLGFVYDPNFDPEGTRRTHGVPVSKWGFLDDKEPIRPRSDQEVVVGLTGGSVAFWFSVQGADAMVAELAKVPAYRGKRIVLIRTALGASKQPQQLAVLTYLLAMGAHFDVLVNLDGFNEIALGPANNVPLGVFPFFPRGWFDMLGQAGDPARVRLVGEITFLEKIRGESAGWFGGSPWRWSPLAACVWTLRDRRLAARIRQAQVALETAAAVPSTKPNRYAAIGPPWTYTTMDAMYRDLVRVWQECSRQMHRLAAANGIVYFHFLQPNQYVVGSKPMSAAERTLAVRPGGPFALYVSAAYPMLQAGGRALAAEGVRFTDLTMVFHDVSAPLYIDDCCHVSAEGNVLMGRRIGEIMRAALSK